MDPGQPATNTEAQALIGKVKYYMDMCARRSHILDPLTEAASGPKGRNILLNDALYIYFQEIKRMVSTETLVSYPFWTTTFTFHTDASQK